MKTYSLLILTGLIFSYLFVSPSFNETMKAYPRKEEKKESAWRALGHQLFFEKRLSANGIKSCASCHAPEMAFTDGYRRSLGTNADVLQRNTPTLLNLAACKTFNWANPNISRIEQQILHPLFNTNPPELGMLQNSTAILQQLQTGAGYKKLLHNAGLKELSWDNVVASLACYVRILNARNSKYDRFLKGLAHLESDEQQGKELFFSTRLNCAACHSGTDFNQPADTASGYFYNTGLYNMGSGHEYADNDNGIANITKNPGDTGKFRVPSMRNVQLTAPYFHDGSAATLEEVIDMYSNGGRIIKEGPYSGDGRRHPAKSNLIHSFSITAKEKKQLIAFLYTLTDTSYMKDPLFIHPAKNK